jgi:DNA polymerase elongation subunit (family B)
MHEYFIMDIETRPDLNLAESCRIFDDENIKIPGNIKKDETIEKYKDEWKAKKEASLALDPKFAIVTLVTMIENCKLHLYENPYSNPQVEKKIIEEVVHKITSMVNHAVPLVTFNGKRFDLPVLMTRGQILDANSYLFGLIRLMQRGDRFGHIDLTEFTEGSLDENLRAIFGFGKKKINFSSCSFPELKKYAIDEILKLEYWYRSLMGYDKVNNTAAIEHGFDDLVSLHAGWLKSLGVADGTA